jgi:hypothetical protein
VLSHQLGGLKGYPAEMLVDFLQRAEDQLLSFLMILVREMGEHLPYDIKIDVAIG